MELEIGITFLIMMIVLMALGVPISFALGVAGTAGLFFVAGPGPALMQVSLVAWKETTSFAFACIPLFILMGQIVYQTQIANDLFRCANAWLGRMSGGLAIASIGGCALFAAVTGSSVAAAATIGSIALPEMKKYNYQDVLATAVIAAGGTLGILIPPSVTFVFYAVLTETSIGALFMAGVIPGILVAIAYALVIYIRCKINPSLGPAGPKYSWEARFKSLKSIWPMIVLVFVVLGGIYAGIFTPTEAAAIGVVAACLIGLVMRRLRLKGYMDAVLETGKVSAMIFAIIIGGILFSRFLVLTGVTNILVGSVLGLDLNRNALIIALIPIYIVLGMFLDVFGMIVLTMPIVFPVLVNIGVDPIWLGVFITMMCEVALITPPVGANVFVIHGIAKGVPLMSIFRGVIPMIAANLAVLVLIIIFPQLCLWLPSTMFGAK